MGWWWCRGGHPFPIQSINACITCQDLNGMPGLNGMKNSLINSQSQLKGGWGGGINFDF